ncbi:hypothetical protein DPMN_146069 [Dreissena polymorpha]|uniref:Uncharacterized protein n=1 Tax=Dreissena polymorpha TaxID=45954 RepID=A0A9D4J1R9_DREPO|nr:hypothetical protein DPMN_146069 [Dreissena polymorpha]
MLGTFTNGMDERSKYRLHHTIWAFDNLPEPCHLFMSLFMAVTSEANLGLGLTELNSEGISGITSVKSN